MDYKLTKVVTPNDPSYGSLWGMQAGWGSDAAAAWDAGFVGTHSVIVGVIDEGFEYAHPE